MTSDRCVVNPAKRRLLYSRANSNLLALNRTLLNSAVAIDNREFSSERVRVLALG
jgi:hypothetical protein